MQVSDHTMVPQRRLGASGPVVPVLALGSWNTWDRMDGAEAAAVFARAVAAGAGFFDVAHYDFGPHRENARTDISWGEVRRASGVPRAGLDRHDMVVVGDCMVRPDVPAIVEGVNALIRDGLFVHWGINNWHIDDARAAIAHARAGGLVPPVFAQLRYGIARRSMAEGPG